MTSVRELWEQHLTAPFPDGLRGSEAAGEDLALLDADIAGCVQTFLANGSRLDPERHAILRRCYEAVSRVELSLSGPGRTYFSRLSQLAQEILRRLASEGADA